MDKYQSNLENQFRGRFFQCGHFANNVERSSSNAESEVFVSKIFKMFENYGVTSQTRGVVAVPGQTFCEKRGRSGINFS